MRALLPYLLSAIRIADRIVDPGEADVARRVDLADHRPANGLRPGRSGSSVGQEPKPSPRNRNRVSKLSPTYRPQCPG